MKAVQIDSYGGPEMLQLRDVPDPQAGEGEIVVDIRAASVNPIDWKQREGRLKSVYELSFPFTMGRDFSGVVRDCGPGVSGLAPGDEVFGMVERQGAYAEALAIPADLVARKPPELSHAAAAALGLVGVTALVALEDVGRLRAGETVLIHAAAGGVGGFAVQYAKHVGARVIATAGARNADYVRGLGADQVIDYAATDFARAVSGCDAVFDTMGGAVHRKSYDVLKPGGRLIFIAAAPIEGEPPRTDVETLRVQVRRERRHIERIAELAKAGAVTAPELTRMTLADAAKAQELSKAGHVRGKIVLDIG